MNTKVRVPKAIITLAILFFLLSLVWILIYRGNKNKGSYEALVAMPQIRNFKPRITKEEKAIFMDILKVLTDKLDSAGIPYYMYYGTLIGSWRHHDMVPWDDDADLLANISDRKAIAELKIPGYTVDTKYELRYKFFSKTAGQPVKDFPMWNWPYIDINFFKDNGTHVYDLNPYTFDDSVANYSTLLPLTRRPFGNLMLKAPHDTRTLLKSAAYECETVWYDHKLQLSIGTSKLDCKHLHSHYPFVIRDPNNPDSKVEKLFLNGKLLQTVTLPES